MIGDFEGFFAEIATLTDTKALRLFKRPLCGRVVPKMKDMIAVGYSILGDAFRIIFHFVGQNEFFHKKLLSPMRYTIKLSIRKYLSLKWYF